MIVHPVIFLDVDTQRDFLMAGGAAQVPGGEAFVPILQKLAAYAFRHRVPLVSTVHVHGADAGGCPGRPPHCIRGTDGQLKVEGTTLGGAVVVPADTALALDPEQVGVARQVILEKQTRNPFDNPHAELVFRSLAPRVVVVFGVDVDQGLRLTVTGLAEIGYRSIVATDAVVGLASGVGGWPDTASAAGRDFRRAGARAIKAGELLSMPDPAQLSL